MLLGEEEVVEITPENTKTFEIQTVYAYLDGQVYDFSPLPKDLSLLVDVLSDDRRRKLGYATVFVDSKNRLAGTIYIDYSSEERLLVETGAIKLWPRLLGVLDSAVSSEFISIQAPRPCYSLRVDAVVLSRVRGADERLPYAGELKVG